MDKLYIAVSRKDQEKLEELLTDIPYVRVNVSRKNVIFNFDKEDWCHPYNPLPPEVMMYLTSLGEGNYGFVRVNESEFEIEVHGVPSNFGIEINIGVKII